MAKPVPLQDRFSGMWRDSSRDQLPKGKVWNLVDYIPELEAPLRKRGGWEYHGSALTALNAGAGVPDRVYVASFSASTQVLATAPVSTDLHLFDLTGSADRGVLFALSAAIGPAVFYREMLIFPSVRFAVGAWVDLGNMKKYVAAGTISDLGGTPPDASVLTVYKDRLLAAANSATPNRIYFSGAGNPESWDTTNRYLDTSDRVVGLAPLRNSVLVFHPGSVERIRGDIPPGSAAANMVMEPLYGDVGLYEADALAIADDNAYFADENGVYQSDGASFSDLTKQGGISAYWRSLISSIGTTGSIALTAWRGYVLVSLQGTSDAFVDYLVCETRSRSWFRFSNIRAYNFATQYGATDELYFSNRDTSSKRVGKLSALFAPVADVKNDADGDAITPVLETGLLSLGTQFKKRWKKTYVSYDVRDAATDNPTLTVSYLSSPEATSYTALTPTLTETTERTRKRVALPKSAYGVALKIAQTNASSDSRLYALEAEVAAQEGSRL